MQDCNPIDTPFSWGENISKEIGPKTLKEKKEMSNVPYDNVIRNLMYAMILTELLCCTKTLNLFT